MPWTLSPARTRSIWPLGRRSSAWRPSAPPKTPISETLPRVMPERTGPEKAAFAAVRDGDTPAVRR